MNASPTMRERPFRRSGLVGPAVLIGLGVIFLLNNLGWLSWDVWSTLGRLWPLLLIALGLDLLIGRRSVLGSLVVMVVVLCAIGAAIWWSGVWMPGSAAATDETITQTMGEATSADVTIGLGAGTLRLGALDDSTALIRGSVQRGPRDQITRSFDVRGDTAVFKLQNRGPSGWMPIFQNGRPDQIVWDLRLNPDAPMRLQVDTGAGTATLDLARLHLSNLNVNTGVGTTTIVAPAQGRVQAHINGGVGATTITIPATMAVRIEATAGLGQVHVQGNYERQEKLYLSPDYATAPNRMELHVSGGVGSITIQQDHGR